METITFFVYQQWSEVMLFCGVHVQHSYISGQIAILNIQKVIPLVGKSIAHIQRGKLQRCCKGSGAPGSGAATRM